ncbi:MAG: DUF262 domain-containing protein, partial [Nitrosopumilus sp.]|nr:DUF262 domain-containing protein [Nitrosopumilus sp.]
MHNSYTAIDFETAQGKRWSICQVGLVRVENQFITEQLSILVQPPDNYYWNNFIDIHGKSPEQTSDAPTFDKIWHQIEPFIKNQNVVAHNGFAFDFHCLKQTLEYYGLSYTEFTVHCTYRIFGAKLASLCGHYKIPLNHHDALSDAMACATLFQIHINSKKQRMVIDKSFSISAKTCTLKYNSQKNGETVFADNLKYVIPIYQRPYSWTDEQIRKFLTDIFLGYWGSDGNIIKEPMFIGTMQLAEKDLVKKEQQVIDGQQRLTTFLILLKVLKIEYPDCKELKSIHFDWLETKVNNGTQQKDFNQLLSFNTFEEYNSNLNTYVNNAVYIKNILADLIAEGQKVSENEAEEQFNADDFTYYILSKIYFVVIETHASLSKTLQIFNAINTTGLDLNGGDIFKLRMYEYLCDQNKEASEETKIKYFEQISGLYEQIDTKNKEIGWVTDIFGILEMYKYILVAKYDLPKTLYFYETNRFFEELFDTISNTNRWDNFKSIKEKELTLSLNELEQIIQSRFQWHLIYKNVPTAEDACSWHFIWWSRYSRYHILPYLFTYKFNSEENFTSNLFLFKKQLSKLFIIYSIRFQKLKSEIYYSFMYEVLDALINKSSLELIELINSKIGKVEDHKGWYDIENILNGDITYNAKLKNIVCRVSAMLEENYTSTDINICSNLFQLPIDIEHI